VLPPHEAALAIVMMRMDFATMHLYHLTRSERARLLDVLLTYYRLHLPSFPELKSVEVLKELFS
jgi:DNA repair protein RecO (recombination protein O)